ncbi:hypothetical protein [Streptosporangium sp. KLBMP 9127]|nr:hypothetical protein [Streptosporangium sp. KLBMP 9127]
MRHVRTARHAHGGKTVDVRRRTFDRDRKAAAVALDQGEASWVIWYGVASRFFYAVPTWNCPGPLIVRGRSIIDLVEQMRDAEGQVP